MVDLPPRRFWVLQTLPWPCCRIGAPAHHTGSRSIRTKTQGPKPTHNSNSFHLDISFGISIVKRYLLCSYQLSEQCSFLVTVRCFWYCPISFPCGASKCQSSIFRTKFQPFWTSPSTSSAKSGWQRTSQSYFEAGFISNSRDKIVIFQKQKVQAHTKMRIKKNWSSRTKKNLWNYFYRPLLSEFNAPSLGAQDQSFNACFWFPKKVVGSI